MVDWKTRVWFSITKWVGEHQLEVGTVGSGLLYQPTRAWMLEMIGYNVKAELAFRGRTAAGNASITARHLGRTRIGAAVGASMAANPGAWVVGGTIAIAAIGAGVHTYYLQKHGLLGSEAPTVTVRTNPEHFGSWSTAPGAPAPEAFQLNPYMMGWGSVV